MVLILKHESTYPYYSPFTDLLTVHASVGSYLSFRAIEKVSGICTVWLSCYDSPVRVRGLFYRCRTRYSLFRTSCALISNFLFMITGLLLVFALPQTASAHVLQTDGSIGAVLHVDPDDNPIIGEKATFFFDLKDVTESSILKVVAARRLFFRTTSKSQRQN